ncbi:alpha/beta fold hydrolase [Microbaculum marinisediminis]|uniref:Alpha/beta hydrolase n=1 Tax=Microbaculum marinisediminis TaxID=2931392 RepID=A0AAW5R6Q4_9HYPH|nr:alpha/beta hydrolase [Microbaculum sp. A6E488]MCT8974314.1 alpha/beta hydrolase [Microbaculum sp. A6E488]
MSDPVPHYVSTPRGQVRIWLAGEGPNLVALAGLTTAASGLARRLSALCPDWRVTVVELPGIGGSSTAAGETVDDAARTLADALAWLGDEPLVLVGSELACAVVSPLRTVLADRRPVTTLFVGADTATAWAKAGIEPGDLAPRQDGTHLQALWAFLRDRHLLDPSNPGLPATEGEPLPSDTELSETFVAAAVAPHRFADMWWACANALRGAIGTGVTTVSHTADLPAALAGLDLPTAGTVPPRTSPGPDGTIWHEYVETRRGRQHLRRAGAAGTPLLVIPTGGGSSAQFAPVVTGLATGRQVFAVDYFGNGLSDKPAGPVSIETLAEDMIALLDAMDLSQVDVWGSHTGSLVALELAVIAPDRVRRLVLEGPVFISQDFQDDLLANYFPEIRPDKWGLHLPLVWNWRRDLFMYWPWYRVDRGAARTLGVPTANELHKYAIGILESGETYDGAYRSAFSYDTRARIPLLERPALVCAGPDDMLKDGLPEAKALGPKAFVTVEETPTTVWWPDPEPAAAAQTLAMYDAFLTGAAS